MRTLPSVLLVACCLKLFSRGGSASDECRGKAIGYKWRHPLDCSRFVVCLGENVQREQQCPAGLHYSLENHICDHAYLVDCKPDGKGRSSPRDNNVHRELVAPPQPKSAPVPHLEPEVHVHIGLEAPQELVHNVHLEIPHQYITPLHTGPPRPHRRPAVPQAPHRPPAERPDQLQIEPGVPTCDRDGLFADPSDCAWYVQCAGGRTYRKPCPAGTYFSHQTGHCGFFRDLCRGEYGPAADRREEAAEPKEVVQKQPPPLGRQPEHPVERPSLPTKSHVVPDPNHLLAGDELMSAVKQYVNHQGMQDAQEMVAEMMKDEAKMASTYAGKKTTFSSVASFLGSTPFTKQLSLPASIQIQFLHNVRDKFDLNKLEMADVMDVLPSILKPSHVLVAPDMPQPHPSMDTCPFPVNSAENQCDPHAPFRTADGSCNNQQHPLWGKSMQALHRFLPPDYADGIDVPRRAGNGEELPSARRVSLEVFEDHDRPSHVHTNLYVTFGQFLDHDMTRTAVTKLSVEPLGSGKMADVTCGLSECDTYGAENRACFPISVPKHDPDFSGKKCLMFVRTQESLKDDCSLAPRQQINQLTSYLDASVIYGSNKEEMDSLRDFSDPGRGRLNTTRHPKSGYKPLLPQAENKDCRDVNSTVMCFHAGDGRANELIGLTALHTMWVRYHNAIEEQLHILNPHWAGERLFQVTRKIVGGVWQHLVYSEFLPITLGTRFMQQYALNVAPHGHRDSYDPHTRAEATNVFATAAFRYGHTMINGKVSFAGSNFEKSAEMDLSSAMRRPAELYEVDKRAEGAAIDAVMHGAMSEPAQSSDHFFTKQVTKNLFSEAPPHAAGMDLVALNLQRGRDHGLPGYNAWRKWCGFRSARSFDDLSDIPVDVRRKFANLYNNVDDIDVFAGGIAERAVSGGTVGPTFACILGRQFRNTQVGDRFWYERGDRTTGFTLRQLSEIRKMTLSSILCNSCDRVDTIQKFALLQPLSHVFKSLGRRNYGEAYSMAALYHGESNERKPCSELPGLDLSAWQERRH